MEELVRIDIKDHIADVRLNRPQQYNALNQEMISAMADAIKRLADASNVRAVVLSGEGKGFCAGLDVSLFQQVQAQGNVFGKSLLDRYDGQLANIYQYICFGWKLLPMPVIAAIHGVAFGGGCQIALGCDIRIATPRARLSIMEMKWGLIPDMSASQTLRDLVSIDVAKELIFTGKVIKGEQASELNLVTRTCDNPYEEAMRLAGDIASNSPHAVRAAKKMLNANWHGDSAAGLLLESQLEMGLLGTPNQLEAIRANFEKRRPAFIDP